MFYGEYHHQLDDKGRLRIPSRIREQLGDAPMVTVGFEKCLMLYTKEDFETKVYGRLEQTDFLSRRASKVKRKLFPRTQPIEEDKQGRVSINPNFLISCGITKNIVTIGVMDHAEIWDEDTYNAMMEELDKEEDLETDEL